MAIASLLHGDPYKIRPSRHRLFFVAGAQSNPKRIALDWASLYCNLASNKILSQEKQLTMTINEAQQSVDQWVNTIGVRYFNELTNMTLLTEEVGELARIMARKFGEQSYKDNEESYDLGDEMADILWILICLANQTGVDLTQALEKNIAKKTNRDQDRHKNNPKLK